VNRYSQLKLFSKFYKGVYKKKDILNKIKSIEEILDILYQLKDDCFSKFLVDKIYQGALLHYLYLVSDTSIALAEMVIKYKKLKKANS
jgi:uncharacterized protein YutE (UPF0331/DUF86 family)